MRRRVLVAGTAAMLLGVACGAPPPPPGPIVSPTGIVYEPGVPPRETRNSQTALQFLRQDRADRALELALEGIQEDSINPIHYFLAGASYARMGEYALADGMFDQAERIYPAYELDTEPEREAAWGEAFNSGLARYEQGDIDGTIDVWRQGTVLYDLRPEAHRNLARLLMSEARYEEAVQVYLAALEGLDRSPATRLLRDEDLDARRVARADIENDLGQLFLITSRFAEAEPILRRQVAEQPESVELRAALAAALTGQGKDGEAREVYATLLSEEALASTELFNMGVGLFRSGEYEQAAMAFQRLTELQPNSRDAWFNYTNSLFAAEAWEALVEAGARLIELDPLGENGHLVTARALLETGDRPGALAGLRRSDAAPIHVDGLQMQRAAGVTIVSGRVVGNAADPESPVVLRFYFYGDAGDLLLSQDVSVLAPATEETDTFEVRGDVTAFAYRYELVS